MLPLGAYARTVTDRYVGHACLRLDYLSFECDIFHIYQVFEASSMRVNKSEVML